MHRPHGPLLPVQVLLGLGLVWGMACKRPETAIRERPVQHVELVQTVQGMTPEEERTVVARLSEGFGVPPEAPDAPAKPRRVFRLMLKGGPDPAAHWGLGKTWAASTGGGFLVGLLLVTTPGAAFTSWETVAIGAGAGGILGFGYGPLQFKHNQDLMKQMGYLPWRLTAEVEVLDQVPGKAQEVAARSRDLVLDVRPFMHPLPPELRNAAGQRQATLKAYVEALLKHLRR